MLPRLLNIFASLLVLVAAVGASGFALLEYRARLNSDRAANNKLAAILAESSSVTTPSSTYVVARADDSAAAADDIKPANPSDSATQTPSPPWTPDSPGPTPSPAYSKLDRAYSFAEVEAILEKLRSERKDRPQARDDIASWFTIMARPAFTGSKDIPEHSTKLGVWRREMPNSPTPLIVLAKAHIAWAWQARGSGFADNVAAEAWGIFHARLEEAHRLLKKAIDLGVNDGVAHSALLEVAKGSSFSAEETRAIFDAGLKIDPAWTGLSSELAIILLPRWGGEPGDVEKLAAKVLKLVPGDDGLDHYGHIAYAINQYEPNAVFFGNYDRPTLVKAGDVMVSRYLQARNLPYFFALCTMAAGDRDAARRLRPKLTAADAPRVPAWKFAATEFFQWCDDIQPPRNLLHRIWVPHYSEIGFTENQDTLWYGAGHHLLSISLYDFNSQQPRSTLTGFPASFRRVAYDSNKRWFAVAAASGIKAWLLWDSTRPERPFAHQTTEECYAVAIHPSEPRVFWSEGNSVLSRDITTRANGKPIELPVPARGLLLSPDGTQILTADDWGSVWDVATGKKLYDLPSTKSEPRPKVGCEHVVAFDMDGRIWAVVLHLNSLPAQRSLVRFAPDGQTWEVLIPNTCVHYTAKQHAAALSPDHRLLALAEPTIERESPFKIQIWDVPTAKMIHRFDAHHSRIGQLTFSPDARRLASIPQAGVAIKIWSIDP